MIIKELSNLKSFPTFIKYLNNKDINVKEFIQSDELAQIGYFFEFINDQGITFMCNNYFIQFANNRYSNKATLEGKDWNPINRETIKFNKYTDSMVAIKIAIIKSFELIMPF